MRYELIVTRQQHTCGGKLPTDSKIYNVTTDDPIEYVKKWEPNADLTVSYPSDGVVLVELAAGDGRQIRYEFAEA